MGVSILDELPELLILNLQYLGRRLVHYSVVIADVVDESNQIKHDEWIERNGAKRDDAEQRDKLKLRRRLKLGTLVCSLFYRRLCGNHAD